MTQEEFTERMVQIANGGYDPESDHADADDLMVQYLREQGLHEAMGAFEGMTKWYVLVIVGPLTSICKYCK